MPLQLGAAAIRDTVAAVFRQRAYDRSLSETLWDRFVEWLGALFSALGRELGRTPWLSRAVVVTLAVVFVVVAARVAYLRHLRGELEASRRLPRGGAGGTRGGDPWLVAQQLATEGNYTDAAHALYRALLEAVARRERVRLHPSKTVGDYARELRQRSSSLWARFRDFARTYEVVVYGIGSCDRERYERLRSLASAIIQPGA